MHATRQVEPEWLDHLPAADPRAIRSRRDLRRVNTLMWNARIVARELRGRFPEGLRTLADLGAGDGSFALRVARSLPRPARPAQVILIDREPGFTPALAAQFESRGWGVRVEQSDVFDALRREPAPLDAVIANLFLHHFEDARLAELLALVARRARFFVACEPRRSRAALLGSRMLGLIGCNDVTRHDAVVSVRAGFRGGELASLWPQAAAAVLSEGPRGMFSHCFVASGDAAL
jgi:2-polyprenyl-3-methyl-5-hydroxy-6-metoxy-1,4-benzoquinol methylase